MTTSQAAGEGNQPGRHPSPAPIPVAEAISRLEKIDSYDTEAAHGEADDVLLAAVDPLIRQAYERIIQRVGEFWYG